MPLLITAVNLFKGISEQKATGLGGLAGSLAELFMMFGMIVTLVFQVTAIILLFRTFSREHWFRSLFSVVSICLSALMILLLSYCVWFFYGGHYRAS